MDFFSYIRWRPGIGDPTVMGWLTVVAYAVAAIASFFAVRSGSGRGVAWDAPVRRRIWWTVGVLMVLLCINKQLDLQSLLTDLGRAFSKQQGWYDQRRGFQKVFVIAVLLCAGVLVGWSVWRCRAFWKTHPMLACGLTVLLTFIVVRAISFHHVDVLLRSEVMGIRINCILELGGIGLIGVAALREIAYQTSERT